MATIIRLAKSTLHVKRVTERFEHHPAFDRGEQIVNFTAASRYRLGRYLRFCSSRYRVFITLTYPAAYPANGIICKKHLKEFLRREQRRNSQDREQAAFSAVWFLEFQKRGAPHFHVFQTTLINAFDELQAMRRRVAAAWFDICSTGDPAHARAGTNVEIIKEKGHVIAYAAKYAAKQDQKMVPNGFQNVGRFWGIVGDREVMAADILLTNSARLDVRVSKEMLSVVSWAKTEEAAGNVRIFRDKLGMISRIVPMNEGAEAEIRRKYWILGARLACFEGVKSEMSGILGMTLDREVSIYSELAG
jgi:hypothetical protein